MHSARYITRVLAAAAIALVATVSPEATHDLPNGESPAVAAPIAAKPAPLTLGATEFYAAPIRLPGGSIDVTRTVTAVKAHGGTSYGFLLYPKAGHNSAREWATLPMFLDAAARARIGVEVVLTPPSSTSSAGRKCSADRLLPYGGHYDRWMTAIGTLAKAHPALVSVAIDDYGYNAWPEPRSRCNTFPPGTITRWNRLLTTTGGRQLTVRPVLYLADLTGSRHTYTAIQAEAPSIIWAFYGWTYPKGSLRSQLQAIRRLFPKARITVLVYVGGEYRGVTPTARMVASDTAAARRQLLPIMYYQHPLT